MMTHDHFPDLPRPYPGSFWFAQFVVVAALLINVWFGTNGLTFGELRGSNVGHLLAVGVLAYVARLNFRRNREYAAAYRDINGLRRRLDDARKEDDA